MSKAFTALLLLLASSMALRADTTDFTVVKVHLDAVQQPKNVLDVTVDCINNPACKTAFGAIASSFGVDPRIVTAGLAIITGGRAPGSQETSLNYRLPAGYVYCHSRIDLISIVPRSGDRDSALSAGAERNGVGVYTWTDKQGLGGGKSWVEADFTVLGVREGLVDDMVKAGRCKSPAPHLLTDCRGGGSHGKPTCASLSD